MQNMQMLFSKNNTNADVINPQLLIPVLMVLLTAAVNTLAFAYTVRCLRTHDFCKKNLKKCDVLSLSDSDDERREQRSLLNN